MLILSDGLSVLYLASQVFALGDMAFCLVALQRRSKAKLLWLDTLAASCGVFHYALLGAWPGMASKVVSATRNSLAAYEATKNKTSKCIPMVFIVFYVLIGICSFESWVSLLPIIAASIYTMAIYRVDATRIRKIALLSATLWLIYNICVVSVVGVVGELVFIVDDIVAIYRFSKKAKKKKKKKKTKQNHLA